MMMMIMMIIIIIIIIISIIKIINKHPIPLTIFLFFIFYFAAWGWIEASSMTCLSEWRECKDENGEVFFYNSATGESSWENPRDSMSSTSVTTLGTKNDCDGIGKHYMRPLRYVYE